ncbi:ZIP family metal transporter [Granulimonas faecalis]|uniref:ZIP family metal transporter n=1 Tax=Granulimonas faecalis TaxID=2894155 RepID=UPI00203A649D
MDLALALLLPLAGTVAGSACMFFMTGTMSPLLRRALTGFAAGVMVAASIWSLIIPAMDQSEAMGKFAFVPALVGFWAGVGFLLLLDHVVPHEHADGEDEGPQSSLPKSAKLALAVIIHNIPEGMAVGALCAGWLMGGADITTGGMLALSAGIAIQNFPEGAIVSMPLRSDGVSRPKAFGWGVFSGVVEPVAALATIALAELLTPVLPYLLGFAAGAMVYVVVEELIPETAMGEGHSNLGTLLFSVGFTLMMVLDVALG